MKAEGCLRSGCYSDGYRQIRVSDDSGFCCALDEEDIDRKILPYFTSITSSMLVVWFFRGWKFLRFIGFLSKPCRSGVYAVDFQLGFGRDGHVSVDLSTTKTTNKMYSLFLNAR